MKQPDKVVTASTAVAAAASFDTITPEEELKLIKKFNRKKRKSSNPDIFKGIIKSTKISIQNVY
jgi:hypothetical protein